MTYRWIIFDADGTLFDYDRAEAGALLETFDAFGVAFEQRIGDLYRRGQPRIGLGVDGNNPEAYRFYERVGMRQVRQFVRCTREWRVAHSAVAAGCFAKSGE